MNAAPNPVTPGRAALATAALTAGSLAGGALLAMALARAGALPAGVDPVRAARRCMMGVTALLLWPFLRAIGVRWPDDLGWRAAGGRPARAFLAGLAAGVATLLALSLAAHALGSRVWNPVDGPGGLLRRSLTYAMSAAAVGVLEETFARGLLFFALRRVWGAVPAALVSAMIFAWAHFLLPPAAAVENPSLFAGAADLVAGAVLHLADEAYIVPRFLNLVLMSLVLCAAVGRSGAIWLPAGLHAGWVWVKKVTAILSDSHYASPWQPWLGGRSDLLDGVACTLMLLGLLAWFLRPAPRES